MSDIKYHERSYLKIYKCVLITFGVYLGPLEAFTSKIALSCFCSNDLVFNCVDVVVQFYPWFKFSFLLFLGMVMCDNEFETKENKI